MSKEDYNESIQKQWQDIRRGEVTVFVDDDGHEVDGWDEADGFLMADVGILAFHAGDGLPPVGYYPIRDERPDDLHEGDYWFTRDGELLTVIGGMIMEMKQSGLVEYEG